MDAGENTVVWFGTIKCYTRGIGWIEGKRAFTLPVAQIQVIWVTQNISGLATGLKRLQTANALGLLEEANKILLGKGGKSALF